MSLAVRGLRFAYGRGRPALFDDIDVGPVARGEFVALVGPNGVGKTTLFRLICGLLRPQAGAMELDGEDLDRLTTRRRQERIFHLTQHTAIRATLTAFDLVLLALKTGGGWRASAADIALVERTMIETGIEPLSDRLVGELSGGQQQLVALSQALVRRPDVLLLDEPTSALDLRRQLEVMELVRRITAERRIVTVAALHDLNLAGRFAERFLLLDRGTITAHGPAEEVLASPALAAAYAVQVNVERTARGSLLVDPYLA